jgi:hypothetical protein
MDLRRHQRVSVRFPTLLSSLSLGDNVGTILDLSPHGCKIQSDMRVVPRMNLVVHVDVPGQESMIAIKQAGVRWVQGGLFGVEFIDLNPSTSQQLADAIKTRRLST